MSHILAPVIAVTMLTVGVIAFTVPDSLALIVTAARGSAPDSGPTDDDAVLWRAVHNDRDLSEWNRDDCGGEFSNGAAYTDFVEDMPNGIGGLHLRVPNLNSGESEGARVFRWCEARQHRALYYSARYYIPRRVQVDGWWWMMEWKSKGSFNAKFGVAVGNRPDGRMYLFVERGQDSGGGTWRQSLKDLPTGQWVHLEVYYKKAIDKSGRVTVWQDGTPIVDITNVRTANSADLNWAVINYGQYTSPSDVEIYIHDAAISTRRLGP